MKRYFILFLLLCVPAFILGNDLGKKAGAEEAMLQKGTEKANATGNPEVAYVKEDGTIRIQLPEKDSLVLLEQAFHDANGKFRCPDPPRETWETKEQWFRKWAEIVVPYVERKYGSIITEASEKHKVSRQRIIGKIVVESCGNPNAVSKAGAMGLIQLMPDTAEIVEVTDPFDPYQNIMGGARYFRYLHDKFGNTDKALAAYYMGETKLREKVRYGYDAKKCPYVRKVQGVMYVANKLNR